MENEFKLSGIKSFPPKLSKACLLMLPEGIYLMSNILHRCMKLTLSSDGKVTFRPWYEPIFLEQIAPLAEREEQWGRIKKAEVNHRHYYLFSSKDEANIHLNGTATGNALGEQCLNQSFVM